MATSVAAALVTQRGRVKGQMTKLATFVNSISDQTSVEELKVRLEHCNDLYLEFVQFDDTIASLPDQSSHIEEFEEKYFTVKATLRSKIAARTPSANPFNSTTLDQFLEQQRSLLNEVSIRNNHSVGGDVVRLPRLNIPTFSGEYREWISFHDLYSATVHCNESLTGAQKLQYLKGLLKGEAAALLRHITIADDNYAGAWDKLCKRYDKRKHTVNAFIKVALDQPVITQSSVSALRRMYNTSDEVIRGLEALGEQACSRDPWLIFLMVNKLDHETRQLWAQETIDIDFPTIHEFLDFIQKHCDTLESCQGGTKRQLPSKQGSLKVHSLHSKINKPCVLCKLDHPLYHCEQFKDLDIPNRKNIVKQNSLCFNCLHQGHDVGTCKAKLSCHICKRRHHSLLHATPLIPTTSGSGQQSISSCYVEHSSPLEQGSNHVVPPSDHKVSVITDPDSSTMFQSNKRNVTTLSSSCSGSSTVLLPTALVYIKDKHGNLQKYRALLDSGSQASFITESCVQRLSLQRKNARIAISGVASTPAGISRGSVWLEITSMYDKLQSIQFEALVLPTLTSTLPTTKLENAEWTHITTLQLADPLFNRPGPVDLLIGADNMFSILRDGRITGLKGQPIAQNTSFGWVLSGTLHSLHSSSPSMVSSLYTDINIDRSLQRFWELEEVLTEKSLTKDEILCDQHFLRTHIRDETGRYVVQLPFSNSSIELGDSLTAALTRLKALERRFKRNPKLKQEYIQVMNEYIELNHMEIIPEEEIVYPQHKMFYLPHHAVMKEASITTKLRIVFDASCKSSTGVSLNENLMVGPTIQPGLISVLLRFRIHNYVFAADIEKMYRQVRVTPEDANYQRIVWRESSDLPILHYRLLTVTFGTAAAPFLATRVLQHLANENKHTFPEAARIIAEDFYVDDLMSGDDSICRCKQLQQQVNRILVSAGFTLRKWTSNSPELMLGMNTGTELIEIGEESDSIKLLGLHWQPSTDSFFFKLRYPNEFKATKRAMLSDSSKIFDPLGWLSPTTILVKTLFQKLWLQKLDWDDELPPDISRTWRALRDGFSRLEEISIPRQIVQNKETTQLHGFCDASQVAYSAVIYSRSVNDSGQIFVNIVAAKTKVAPLKLISIPRLELCGAVLLTRLMKSIREVLNLPNAEIFTWTDSTIVLHWLSSHPRRWKTFVANRVSEILEFLPRSYWNHVTSEHNPADCASRGLTSSALLVFNLWWKGPNWLSLPQENWPRNVALTQTPSEVFKEERQPMQIYATVIAEHPLQDLMGRHSSWTRIVRIVAFCLRFINNISQKSTKIFGQLTTSEFRAARTTILKWVQRNEFYSEFQCLTSGKALNKGSKLLSLTPFIDANGLIRVGGRLQQSTVPYDCKHPVLLPERHKVTEYIINEFHRRYLHPSTSTLVNILRQQYWILRCKHAVRRRTFQCITCFKHNQNISKQLMGNLPESRVRGHRPFLHTGVDYAGPISLKTVKGRTGRRYKGYIALFVCLSTKAYHLEVVTDLSSEAFIAALRRFTSRRGVCSDIYSDNGSNFVGAKSLLDDMHKLLLSQVHNRLISNFLLSEGIQWHFIPPASPNFGGLWESGVKAVKHHIRRVIGDSALTYEELTTLLTQVEGILNSRPLSTLSSNDEPDALTPGHFLVGHPITAIPGPCLLDMKTSGLTKWQQIQQMIEGFWKRWHQEYLTTLQQRPKWKSTHNNVKIDDVVVVKEVNIPPNRWPLGKVLEVHPGTDGLVRVVTLKMKDGTYKRSISKICVLPLLESTDSTRPAC